MNLCCSVMLVLHDEMVVGVVIAIQSIYIVSNSVFNETGVTPEKSCKAPHQQNEYQIVDCTIQHLSPEEVIVTHE